MWYEEIGGGIVEDAQVDVWRVGMGYVRDYHVSERLPRSLRRKARLLTRFWYHRFM